MLSVILRFIDSDYLLGIFKIFLSDSIAIFKHLVKVWSCFVGMSALLHFWGHLNIFFCWSHIVIWSISTNCPWYWKSSVIMKSNSFWRYWWKQWRQFCRSRCDNIDYVCLIRHRCFYTILIVLTLGICHYVVVLNINKQDSMKYIVVRVKIVFCPSFLSLIVSIL